MIVGMDRVPLTLYTPVDGDWAKWNVEAILHFGKVFDLSPYSMLAGMGSMYFPNLPWLNPGALALALPFSAHATSIASYAVYAAEVAISIVVLARVIGFSWLTSSVAAQLYLYLLFPPFSHIFRIYDWYSLAPYYAHLQAALNGAAAVLLVCGRLRDWRGNAILAAAFLALFISELLSAPFTFVFATPAYAVICAALILTRWPSPAEWAWKIAALALCLIFLFGSGSSTIISAPSPPPPAPRPADRRGTGSCPRMNGFACFATTRYAGSMHASCCASSIVAAGCKLPRCAERRWQSSRAAGTCARPLGPLWPMSASRTSMPMLITLTGSGLRAFSPAIF